MRLFLGKERQKGTHIDFFGGIWGSTRGPKRATLGQEKFSFNFFFPALTLWHKIITYKKLLRNNYFQKSTNFTRNLCEEVSQFPEDFEGAKSLEMIAKHISQGIIFAIISCQRVLEEMGVLIWGRVGGEARKGQEGVCGEVGGLNMFVGTRGRSSHYQGQISAQGILSRGGKPWKTNREKDHINNEMFFSPFMSLINREKLCVNREKIGTKNPPFFHR